MRNVEPRVAHVVLATLTALLGACVQPPEAIDSGAVDAGRSDVPTMLDAPSLLDAPTALDAPAALDADLDASSALDVRSPPRDAGPCQLDRTDHVGTASPYTSGATACYPSITRGGSSHGAAIGPTDTLAPLIGCGTCARVTGPVGTELVVIDDVCPSCAAGSLDLPEATFLAVTGTDVGFAAITWELAPCEVSGNVRFQLEASNPFFVLVRFLDHVTPLASVTVRTSDAMTHTMTRNANDSFVLTGVGEIRAPLTFVVTDAFGASIDAPLTAIDSGVVHDAGAQFPVVCVP